MYKAYNIIRNVIYRGEIVYVYKMSHDSSIGEKKTSNKNSHRDLIQASEAY